MQHTHLADYAAMLPRSPYNRPPFIDDARAGRLIPRDGAPRRKVAIVGAGHGKEFAPLRDDEWEVWALNAVPVLDHAGFLRADRWFEMHQRHAQTETDMRWIRACEVPIYLPPAWAAGVLSRRESGAAPEEDVPMAVAYPLAAIEQRWGSYWTCTFAYQIALALHEGFGTIGLYGVELAYGTPRERSVEWACVSYWIGLCRGLGVTIALPPSTSLGCHRYRYGVEYDAEKASVERWLATMAKADRLRGDVGMGG